jgi:RNA polymerase sigma factor (sigma-70 family)
MDTVDTSMWDASDEALFAGFATGDLEAGTVFVRRFQARVFGLALGITRDPVEADEVAQDAFVRAWRYAASFDARRGTVAGWLLGITRNVALDQVRLAANRRERVESGDGSLGLELVIDVSAGEEVAEAAERHDALTRVAASLRALPPEQQEALIAVTLRGLSTREYAEAAGLPLGTAKTRIRLGLRKLRQRLEVHAE